MSGSKTPPSAVDHPTIFQAFDDPPTLTDPTHVASPSSEAAPVDPDLPSSNEPGPRYLVQSVLGRGGMGEVRLCKDTRIGREVAIKVAHPNLKERKGDDGRRRFLREARIQGQLEHPSIVPVHEIDKLDDGAPYFAMKRVRGVTLAQILADQRRGNADTVKRYPLRKLLAAMGNVCLAVDFAHSRGVLHRDVKPGNIMLGDFGEVYVLDWGLARVMGTPDDEQHSKDFGAESEEITDGGVKTEAGRILGTPGYMAPEQLDPSLGEPGPAVDVYGLGALLFEIVTKKPLIEARDRTEVMLQTLQGVEVRPSVRAPEAQVPPALEAILVRALAREPAQRYASARAVYEALDAFLAGEEAIERRRELARMHASTAEKALERYARDASELERTAAMQELGRALALDPENVDARGALVKLLTSPPPQMPTAVKARLDDMRDKLVRDASRGNALFIFAWLLFIPISMWLGVLRWTPVILTLLPLLGMAMVSWFVYRQKKPREAPQYLVVLLTILAYVGLSRSFGPFIVVPTLLTVLALSFQLNPDRRLATNGAVLCALGLVAIPALEAMGVLAPSYEPVPGGLLIRENMLWLSNTDVTPVTAYMLFGSLVCMVLPTVLVSVVRQRLTAAEEKLQLQAWWLEQLVSTKREPVSPEGGASR